MPPLHQFNFERERELICHIGPCIRRPQFLQTSPRFPYYQVSTTLQQEGGEKGKKEKEKKRAFKELVLVTHES